MHDRSFAAFSVKNRMNDSTLADEFNGTRPSRWSTAPPKPLRFYLTDQSQSCRARTQHISGVITDGLLLLWPATALETAVTAATS